MSIYDVKTMGEALKGNSYVGRGIAVGQTADGARAAFAYFIMGRSENSRNRIFREEGDDVVIYPFDEKKAGDPSLIIYAPVRTLDGCTVVTNGNQTDTICEYLKNKKGFREALATREFEPDAPNFTPRISAILKSADGFRYSLSILKSADAAGSACNRYTFDYAPLKGIGHFIHTYNHDGNPIPTFTGEPERIAVPDSIEQFAADIWQNLDEANKISLYVRYIDLKSGKYEKVLINKNA